MTKWQIDATGIQTLDFPDGSGFVAVERDDHHQHRGMALYWAYVCMPKKTKLGTIPYYKPIAVHANSLDAKAAATEWYSQNIGAVE